MKYHRWFRTLCFLFVVMLIAACSREETVQNKKNIIITANDSISTAFYAGSIQPIKTFVIPSPAEGAVVEMTFQYGDKIKAQQLLFLLSSSKFLADYKAALMQYIKAKSEFNNSRTQLSEATFLHKNQLISADDFKAKQSSYYAGQLAFLQAKDALNILLQQMDIKNSRLYQLTIADIDKITEALHLQRGSENLRILSPIAGVVLSPIKSEDDSKKIMKGDVVKQGDVLAVIGDMSGISVRIKVNEISLNQLKIGQKVKITGVAFPEATLNGEIERIDRQADVTSGSLPTFAVRIIVPHLTEKEQQVIHVGMSANVAIEMREPPRITVPLSALIEKNGVAYVNLWQAEKNNWQQVAVKTGKTTTENVVILSGLKIGDKIASSH